MRKREERKWKKKRRKKVKKEIVIFLYMTSNCKFLYMISTCYLLQINFSNNVMSSNIILPMMQYYTDLMQVCHRFYVSNQHLIFSILNGFLFITISENLHQYNISNCNRTILNFSYSNILRAMWMFYIWKYRPNTGLCFTNTVTFVLPSYCNILFRPQLLILKAQQ